MQARNLVLAFTISTPLAAQGQVHVVAPAPGPGVDFTSLPAAVAAAAPGTILLLKSGDYAGFSSDGRAIHVVADTGATARIATGVLQLRSTPAAQSCSLRGLDVATSNATWLFDNAGATWIEDCRLDAGVEARSSASAGFARCATTGLAGEVALRVQTATFVYGRVWSFDCSWRGNAGIGSGSALDPHGASAIVCANAELFASGGLARGGDGATWAFGASCVQGAGGQGAFITIGGIVRHLGAAFAGGVPSTGCGLPPSGGEPIFVVPGSTANALPGTARSLVASSPVREGQTATIDVHGAPGELALVVWGQDFQVGAFTPEWSAPLLVAGPQRVIALGALPANGAAQLSFTVGELGAGVEGARAVAQGAFIDPGMLSVQLGSASELVALDASL